MQVSLEDLTRSFRRGEKTFVSKVVQVRIEAKAYKVSPGRIEAYRVREDAPGCVYFEAPFLPTDNERELVVTGECRGKFKDGIHRAIDVDYYILVANCSIFTLEKP